MSHLRTDDRDEDNPLHGLAVFQHHLTPDQAVDWLTGHQPTPPVEPFPPTPPQYGSTGPSPAPRPARPVTVQPRRASPFAGDIDWQLVRRLKEEVIDVAGEPVDRFRARHGASPTGEDRRQLMLPLISDVLRRHRSHDAAEGVLWSAQRESAYHKALSDSVLGYGRLQPLFELPGVENVTICGPSVVARYGDGTTQQLPAVSDNDQDLLQQFRELADLSSRKRVLDAQHTDMTLMIGDRFRVHVVSDEITVHPTITIRQHNLTQVSLADLADLALMPLEIAQLLDAAVQAGQSIVVAGPQGVGKTTLLRALIDAIPEWERFGTFETDIELFAHLMPGRENNPTFLAREGMGERDATGALTGAEGVAQMIDKGLRQALDRLIVGELRGPGEASSMFQAMQTGTGTMASTHAKNVETIADRLASRVAEGGVYSQREALAQVAYCIDLLIYVDFTRDRDGRRRRFIRSIRTCEPGDNGAPSLGAVYDTDPRGENPTYSPTKLEDVLRWYSRDLQRHRNGEPVA